MSEASTSASRSRKCSAATTTRGASEVAVTKRRMHVSSNPADSGPSRCSRGTRLPFAVGGVDTCLTRLAHLICASALVMRCRMTHGLDAPACWTMHWRQTQNTHASILVRYIRRRRVEQGMPEHLETDVVAPIFALILKHGTRSLFPCTCRFMRTCRRYHSASFRPERAVRV